MNAVNNVVEIKDLRVEYPGRQFRERSKLAVDGLNLQVRSGEVFGFLGPNGAGKTTTMNVLLGFVNATSGSASIFGVDVRQPIARQRIGARITEKKVRYGNIVGHGHSTTPLSKTFLRSSGSKFLGFSN